MESPVQGMSSAMVRKILSSNFKRPKTTIHPKAVDQMTKVVNIAIVECALRSGKQGLAEDSRTVTADIMKKVLPQMVNFYIDFGFINELQYHMACSGRITFISDGQFSMAKETSAHERIKMSSMNKSPQ